MSRAGRKNEQVTLHRPSWVSDGQGGETAEPWSQVGPVTYAEIATAATAAESYVASQVMAPARRLVTVWYTAAWAAAKPDWRIWWAARETWLLVHVVEDVENRHRELRVHCSEIQGASSSV